MILVTGGTGLVGSHLLFQLTTQGKKVRAIFRNPKRLDKVKRIFSYYSSDAEALFQMIEWVEGDILDVPSLETAFSGVTKVYHCAALISFQPYDYFKMRQVNIAGTANVVNLCLQFKIEKLCYVSSIAALGSTNNAEEPINEEQDWQADKQPSAYSLTKYGGEMEVWRGTQEGLKAVIVNPGVIFGPGFWRSGSGAIFTMVQRGLKYYPTGRTGFVHVDDVVTAMTDLMNSEVSNERFILVSENGEWKNVLQQIAQGLSTKAPKRVASKSMLTIALWSDALRSTITGKQRRITRASIRSMANRTLYDGSKITNTLGLKYQSLSDSISSCCAFLQKES